MNGDGVCEIEGVGKRKYEFMTNTNTNTNLMRIVWLVPDVLELQLS